MCVGAEKQGVREGKVGAQSTALMAVNYDVPIPTMLLLLDPSLLLLLLLSSTGFDAATVFKTEKAAWEATSHEWLLETAETEALRVLKQQAALLGQ